MKLQRSMSNISMLGTSLSCMIGSGWLFGAVIAAKIAGPAAIISWIIGGAMVTFIAFTFSELSTMLPVSGGIARFIQFSHGTFTSFCTSWLAWLSCVAVAPTEVGAMLYYLANFFPSIMEQSSNYHVLSNFGIIVAISILLIITILNVLTMKFIGKITTIIGSWKVIVPLLTAVVIIFAKFDIHNFWQFRGFSPNGIHGILMAVSSVVIFSFLGFREATSLAGEAKNPQKAIPIAVIGSVCICLLLYITLQISFIGSVNSSMLDAGWSNIHFSGDFGPFAGIATTLGLSYLAYLIYLDSVVSPMGTGFTYTTTTARINYAMSKNKYTPSNMLKLNRNGIPINAIIFNFIIGIALLLPFPEWEELIKFQSVAIIMAYGSGPIAMLALRTQKPELNRPFKVFKPKLFAFITLYICNLIIYWTGFNCIWRLMIALLAGIVLLLCYRACTKEDMYPINILSAWWLLLQFIGITIISYLGSFEGIGVITFGADFAIIAIFSAMILVFSQYCKLPKHEVTIMLDNAQDEIAS